MESESVFELISDNSNTDSDTDSDTKTVRKLVNLKSPNGFDTVAYSLEQTIKIGKLRVEIAIMDENMDTLENDYNNLKLDFDLQQETINKQKKKINIKNNIINLLGILLLITVNNLRN